MTDSPADAPGATDALAVADALTGPTADRVLDGVLGAVGATRHDWRLRSVHRRGSSSVAVVYEVDLTDSGGRRRERLYVAHASTKPVPAGAARVDLDGTAVHVWQFPNDPYLPGLPTAVDRAEAARLLRRLGLDAGAGEDTHGVQPAIRTRSYRPTRRAVVELRPGEDLPPAAYVKLLGGRTPRRVRRRAQRLATVHERLGPTLPVPPVLDHSPEFGRVVLGAIAGTTLRAALRAGQALPDPAVVRDLLADLHGTPTLPALPGGADPDRFADIGRHVARLGARLPERVADLEGLAAVADTVGGPRGTVHGDLHDGQLLVVDGTVTAVLDVDGAGTGTIAHDLGRLLAHLDASRLVAPGLTDRVDAYVTGLAGALGDLAPPRDVAAAAAAAWVGLATGPLRVAMPDWHRQATARIDRALVWAARAR